MAARLGRRTPALITLLLLGLLALLVPAGRAAAAGTAVHVASGDHQTVAVGQTFGALKVQVVGPAGPQTDTRLEFVATGDAQFRGGYPTSTVYSGDKGYAVPADLVAGARGGAVTVEVRLADGQVGATFHLDVQPVPEPREELRVVAGDDQSVPVGSAFADLVVVAERDGGPVAGVPVTFSIEDDEQTGASFDGSSTTVADTATDGRARARVRGGDRAGQFRVRAESTFGVATFVARSTRSGVLYLEAVAGDDQQAWIGSEFPDRVIFRVRDDRGDPVAGQRVDFYIGNERAVFEAGTRTSFAYSGQDGTALAPKLVATDSVGDTSVMAVTEGAADPCYITRLQILMGRS